MLPQRYGVGLTIGEEVLGSTADRSTAAPLAKLFTPVTEQCNLSTRKSREVNGRLWEEVRSICPYKLTAIISV